MLHLFLLVLFAADRPAPPAHEFHLSKSLVEYVKGEQAIQITMHLFIDDFEEALRQQGKDKLHICSDKESPEAEPAIYQYLQSTFKITLDGREVTYSFIGKEISEDLMAMWCYLEVENVTSFSKMQVVNSILTEVFEDQKNLVSVIGPEKKKDFFMLDNKKHMEVAEF